MRVLAITPAPTHPTTAGNRARFRSLLDHLEARGAVVRLAHIQHEFGDFEAMAAHWSGGAVRVPFTMPRPRFDQWNRFACRARKYLHLPLRERADVDDWYDPESASVIAREVEQFQPHAIVMLYLWNSAALAALPPGIPRILDAQDVFTDRNARMKAAGIDQHWFSVSRAEEARGLQRFDAVVAIQEFEAAYYRSITTTPVFAVGHFLPVVDVGAPALEPRLLLIGSNNDVNVHGMRWFLTEVWPALRARRPDIHLDIVGRLCDYVTEEDGVTRHGVVPDLAPAYGRCAVVISPLRGGTGLKIKTAEALGAGRAVVATPSSAIGLEEANGRGLVVCRSASDMTEAIISLLADHQALTKISADAAVFAREWNERSKRTFDSIFADIDIGSSQDHSP